MDFNVQCRTLKLPEKKREGLWNLGLGKKVFRLAAIAKLIN